MTPSGSLKRSKRDTCTRIGRRRSMPNRSVTAVISASESSRFLSLSGSMDGAMSSCGIDRSWANCGTWKMAAWYLETARRRNRQTRSLGRDTSMWQRHTACAPSGFANWSR